MTIIFRILLCTWSVFGLSQSAVAQAISFEEAYQEVFCQAYAIRAAEEGVESSRSSKWQAGRLPNPLLAFGGQNLGPNHSDSDDNELFVAITQPIELGGKRSARVNLAEATECVSNWDLAIVKNALANDLLHAFISVAAAQERLTLASQQAQFTQETLDHIKVKEEAGRSPSLEIKKAEIAKNTALVAISQEQSALKQELRQLRAFWPDRTTFTSVEFPLYTLQEPPTLEQLTSALPNNPIVGKAQASTVQANRVAALESSQRIPNVAVQVGVSTESWTKYPALTVGIDIPIPIFDRNSGNIDSARHDYYRSLYEEKGLQQRLLAELEVTYHEWIAAYFQALTLKNEIIPKAEEAHTFSKEGFQEGKFNYLEFLDAQKTLLEVKQQYLDAVEAYHHKRADVLKLSYGICQ